MFFFSIKKMMSRVEYILYKVYVTTGHIPVTNEVLYAAPELARLQENDTNVTREACTHIESSTEENSIL